MAEQMRRVDDPDRRPLLAEVLLDLAQRPERLLELEDTESQDAKLELLRKWYPGLIEGGRGLLVENNLHQIRVNIEADIVSSPGHTLAITWLVITF